MCICTKLQFAVKKINIYVKLHFFVKKIVIYVSEKQELLYSVVSFSETTIYVSALVHCRKGVYIMAELDNFSMLLHRLRRVHSLFARPHPLAKVADYLIQSREADCSCTDSDVVSMESFHRKFLNYLVENRFFSLMNHYLDMCGYVDHSDGVT